MATKGSDRVVVRRGRRREVIRDRKLSFALRRAFELYQQARAFERELSGVKEVIAARARDFTGPKGAVSFETDGLACGVRTTPEAVIPEENVVEVRRLLGRRFYDLVRVKKKYLGSARLLDGGPGGEGHAEFEEVRKLLVIKESAPRITWQAAGGEPPY